LGASAGRSRARRDRVRHHRPVLETAGEFLNQLFDIVVTVCDAAAADCPVWPGAKRLEHWPIVDPSFGPDDPATRPDRFAATRDELARRIEELVPTIE
jgi:arsenate reductase